MKTVFNAEINALINKLLDGIHHCRVTCADMNADDGAMQEGITISANEAKLIINSIRKNARKKPWSKKRIPISQLPISMRAYLGLKSAGAETLSDIANITYSQLLEQRNVGVKTANEIEKMMDSFGLELQKK